jgi:hypothetical protein
MDGHEKLLHDIEALLDDSKAKHFHDFESDFATPKVVLVQRLEALMENAKNGRYDN